MTKTIVVIGTLDSKVEEILFARDQIEQRGYKPIVVDLSVGSKPAVQGDITSEQVAKAGGGDIHDIWGNPDRPRINKMVTDGAISVVHALYNAGKLDGIIGIGGAGGSLIETDIMKSLPFGVPKFMVSSNAGARGFASRYFGTKDITMMHTVADIAGLNDMLELLLCQAIAAICAMSEVSAPLAPGKGKTVKKQKAIALCELMLSAESVQHIKKLLEDQDYQVIVFMATGVGDTAMEELIDEGFFDAVIDLSPGGILDSIIGGTRKACSQRLETAGRKGIPQIIAPGGLDFITPSRSQYKPEYDARKRFEPDKLRLQIRSSKDELIQCARIIAKKLNRSKSPVKFLIPLKGWSRIDGPGRPLDDPEAIIAFSRELRENCKPEIDVVEIDAWIEDHEFGVALVEALNEMMSNEMSLGEPISESDERWLAGFLVD